MRLPDHDGRASARGSHAETRQAADSAKSRRDSCGERRSARRRHSGGWRLRTVSAIFCLSFWRVCTIAWSTRSRMIVSTSRPWYPTSVNFVASTFASARVEASGLPFDVGFWGKG